MIICVYGCEIFICGVWWIYRNLLLLCFNYDSIEIVDKLDKVLKAAYVTLGCKLNFSETSSLADRLEAAGIERVAEGEVADICVVNTCSVTETSHHKCRQAIARMLRQNPGAMMVVMGCYAQLAGRQVAELPGVDVVINMEDKARAAEIILGAYADYLEARGALGGEEVSLHRYREVARKDVRSFVPSCSRGERTRFFLKVQDGCDYFCTYCTIPIARGRSRNGRVADIVAQAEEAARLGGREIVITGVNIGDFGKTTGESFLDLIKALDKVEGIGRYRISSIEPNLLTPEVIDFCAASERFMPHFHIPLQSGSDDVLRLMHRRYDTALFASRIDYIKKVMPDAFIGVDIIVGTRGETDAFFEDSYRFASGIDVSQYHVFSYSERPGTAALRIPYVVDEKVKHERSKRLLALSEQKRLGFYGRYVGSTRPLLTEHSHEGLAAKGFTDNYIRVEIAAEAGLLPDNEIINCTLTGFNADKTALVGRVENICK